MKLFVITFFSLFFCYLCYGQKELQYAKGRDAISNEEYNLALYYFNQAIKEDDKYVDAFLGKGLAQYNLGNWRNALETYKYVLKINPDNAHAYFGIASIYNTWQEDHYKAIEYYDKAYNMSIRDGDKDYAGSCKFMTAVIKWKIGDKTAALKDYKTAAELGNPAAIGFLEIYYNQR